MDTDNDDNHHDGIGDDNDAFSDRTPTVPLVRSAVAQGQEGPLVNVRKGVTSTMTAP